MESVGNMVDPTTQLTVYETTEEIQEASAPNDNGDVIFILATFLTAGGAFVLNGFNFVALMTSKKMRQKLSLVFLAHQSGCDGITGALIVMFYTIELTYGSIEPEGLSGRLYCHLAWSFYLPFVGLYAGMFNTVFMSIERYTAIAHPLKYKKFACKKTFNLCALSCWILGAVFNAPVVFATKLHKGQCTMIEAHEIINSTYLYISVAVCFITPQTIVLVLYVKMFVIMKRRQDKVIKSGKGPATISARTNSSQEWTDKMYSAQMKLALLAVVIEVSFVISWTPGNIYKLMYLAGVKLTFADFASYISSLMTVVNIIVNPIVFMCMCEEFQIRVKKLFNSGFSHG